MFAITVVFSRVDLNESVILTHFRNTFKGTPLAGKTVRVSFLQVIKNRTVTIQTQDIQILPHIYAAQETPSSTILSLV